MSVIRTLDQLGRGDLRTAGGKGANLGELVRAGLPVPPGFVITTAAYDWFVGANDIARSLRGLTDLAPSSETEAYSAAAEQVAALFVAGTVPEDLVEEIGVAYVRLGDQVPVAVRSSATAEDLPEASFAGQQDTFLNVEGPDAVLRAVRSCWASLWNARALSYRARQGIDASSVSSAVVVQRLVPADAAGVMFTANPSNGRRDQVVIGAAWGLGESVVSGTVNTDDIVLRAGDGTIASRQTADKTVMTILSARGTTEVPVPEHRRREPVLSDEAAAELGKIGIDIQSHFGVPQDIEWASADGKFYVLQSRPITALAEPEGPVPSGWPLPDPKSLYFRASIVEQLPDPLSPLFADLAAESVPRSLTKLMRELLGGAALRDGDVTFPTINGYAYYRYTRGSFGRILLYFPLALRSLAKFPDRAGVRRWRDHSHPRYAGILADWRDRDLTGLSPSELITGIIELLDAGTEYYTAVQTIIPLAASSETLFSSFYNDLVRRPGDPTATTFLLGFDSAPIRAEKSLYDLATWTSSNPALSEALRVVSTVDLVAALGSGHPPDEVDAESWRAWSERFQDHLDHFGHAVYNLDFVNAVPADDPAPLLETLRFYLRGEGNDPYQRQQGSVERREAATAEVLARIGPARRTGFVRLLGWAQGVAPVREDALADVGLAWPQLRRMLRELGRRLVAAEVIDRADDVFWLHRAEIETALAGSTDVVASLDEAVSERKIIWRGQRRATPPQWLPEGAMSRRFEGMMPAVAAESTGNVIKGIGASSGQVTAAARVLGGPDDFGQLRPGDVLVASITTPAWTPLFAMASGVVTDIGGPLSHSSIVAREYQIPAVLGTGVATRRIVSGQLIRVDGDTGEITLLGDQGDADASRVEVGAAATAAAHRELETSRRRRLVTGAIVAGTITIVVGWLVRRQARRG